MIWCNMPLYHLLKWVLALCHALFVRKKKTKYQKRWYRSMLRQTMVESWYCLDRVVAKGMSQVSRRLEAGNHKRHTLNTRQSSGTSAGTFAVSAGPYIHYCAEAGTKNEPDTFFVPVQKKGWKIDPHVSNILADFFFRGFRSTLKSLIECWPGPLPIQIPVQFSSLSFIFGHRPRVDGAEFKHQAQNSRCTKILSLKNFCFVREKLSTPPISNLPPPHRC